MSAKTVQANREAARILAHRQRILERLPLVYIETTIPAGQTIAEYRKARRVSSPAMVR